MEILLFYIALVVLVTIIGNSVGRGFGGFFISLILSPLIGLIWVLAMPDLSKKEVVEQ